MSATERPPRERIHRNKDSRKSEGILQYSSVRSLLSLGPMLNSKAGLFEPPGVRLRLDLTNLTGYFILAAIGNLVGGNPDHGEVMDAA